MGAFALPSVRPAHPFDDPADRSQAALIKGDYNDR